MKKFRKIYGHISMSNLSERLKIIKVNHCTYIIDVDQIYFWVVFPFYHWFFSVNAYIVPAEEERKLETINYEKRKNHPLLIISAGLSPLLGFFITPLVSVETDFQNKWIKVTMFLFAILIAILLRVFLHKKNSEVVKEIQKFKIKKLKVYPVSKIFYIKNFLLIFLFLVMIYYSIVLYFEIPSFIIAIAIFMFVSLYINFNLISILSDKVYVEKVE